MPNPTRSFSRTALEARPLSFEFGFNRYAEGSVLIKSGHTHVLCTASIEEKVPEWMKGKGRGWVTAEYAMLPRSTHTRSKRDREKVSGRTHEIQRLIGRSLRGCVDLGKLGERSILIDCDVLQADGGTRTASVTGASLALQVALSHLEKTGKLATSPWLDSVCALSVGIKNSTVLVDLDYEEDSQCEVDMNFVMTGKGQFIEVQGTAEKGSFSHSELLAMTSAAQGALSAITKLQREALENHLRANS